MTSGDEPRGTPGPASRALIAGARTEPARVGAMNGKRTIFVRALRREPPRDAAERLGFVSAIFAVGFFASWIAAPPEAQPLGVFPMLDVSAAVAIGASLLMIVLARVLQDRVRLLADIYLAYSVLYCFTIALSEQWLPWPKDHVVRGVSWICLVVFVLPLLVPWAPKRALAAALLGATTGPIALWIAVGKGNPAPSAQVVAGLFLPSYLSAGLAWLFARIARDGGPSSVRELRRLGAYELDSMLGKGGMGEVWSAKHRLLARGAAVKLVRPDAVHLAGGEDPQKVLRRFEREARATSMLGSPHTISIYDFGILPEGTFYYAMELLDGLDLETLVERHGAMPAERVVHVLVQVCRSLEEAHARGMIHRDIKPANIYLCRMGLIADFVKVLDFGLVVSDPSSTQPFTRLTSEGLTSGTPGYMAPEIAEGRAEIDGRADLYALGCVAYWMLTGVVVFEGSSPMKVLLQHVQSAPVPPSVQSPNPIPRDVEEIVLGLLKKTPEERPQTARELRRRLESCGVARDWTEERASAWWDQMKGRSQAGQ